MFTGSQDITLTVQGHTLLNPYDCTYLQGLYLPVQQALDVPCHLLHQLLRLILLHLKQIPVVFVDLEGSRSQASGQGGHTFPRHCPCIASVHSTVQRSPPLDPGFGQRERGGLGAGCSALMGLEEGHGHGRHSLHCLWLVGWGYHCFPWDSGFLLQGCKQQAPN